METLNGELAQYEIRHADGSEIDDEFGRDGQLCATYEEAEKLARLHREAGSDVQIVELDDDSE
jgi:hypothetical protein